MIVIVIVVVIIVVIIVVIVSVAGLFVQATVDMPEESLDSLESFRHSSLALLKAFRDRSFELFDLSAKVLRDVADAPFQLLLPSFQLLPQFVQLSS